jgi:hypothetical protein
VLVIMGAAALVTQNMLAVLVAGSALLALRHYRPWGLAARPTRTGGDYPSALQSTQKHR